MVFIQGWFCLQGDYLAISKNIFDCFKWKSAIDIYRVKSRDAADRQNSQDSIAQKDFSTPKYHVDFEKLWTDVIKHSGSEVNEQVFKVSTVVTVLW